MQLFQKWLPIPVTTLADIVVMGCNQNQNTSFTVKNAGAAALNGFEVWVRSHPDADYMKIASIAADYTSPSGFLIAVKDVNGAAISPVTLASAAEFVMTMDTRGIESVKLRASCGTSTILNVYGNVGGDI